MYKRKNWGWLKHIDFVLGDVFALQLAFVTAYLIRHGVRIPYANPDYRNLAIVMSLVDILVAAVFNTMHNVLRRDFRHELVQSIKQVVLVFAAVSTWGSIPCIVTDNGG